MLLTIVLDCPSVRCCALGRLLSPAAVFNPLDFNFAQYFEPTAEIDSEEDWDN